MKTIFILLPLYNDWESLTKLINKIEIKVKQKIKINLLIVNDKSYKNFKISNKTNQLISRIKIINLKKNIGHDRAIVSGLYYLIKKNIIFDSVITMDSDGEDDPKYLSKIINMNLKNPNDIIVCKREKRNESLTFKTLYYIHLIVTFFFTYKWLNHGGYNLLPKKTILALLKSKTIWGNYSASIERLKIKKKFLKTNKGKRYFGPSQTSFLKLFFHSLNIMTVFKEKIILNAFIYSFLIFIFSDKSFVLLTILLIIFLFIATAFYSLSLREHASWKKNFFKNISY
jgi:hypothetical protein